VAKPLVAVLWLPVLAVGIPTKLILTGLVAVEKLHQQLLSILLLQVVVQVVLVTLLLVAVVQVAIVRQRIWL
jgi:hypothetical protein